MKRYVQLPFNKKIDMCICLYWLADLGQRSRSAIAVDQQIFRHDMFSLLQPGENSLSPIRLNWNHEIITTSDASAFIAAEVSLLDRLAAPTVFLEQVFLFDVPLDEQALRAAVTNVLTDYSPFGWRLSRAKCGQLQLIPTSPTGSSGIDFLHASTDQISLQHLLLRNSMADAHSQAISTGQFAAAQAHKSTPDSRQQLQSPPDLADLLFRQLPGSLVPDYVNSDRALVTVALLHLQGGSGSVLGVRLSHLLSDWAGLRLLVRKLAAGYSCAGAVTASNAGHQQQQQQQQQQKLAPAAPLLNGLVTALIGQQQQQPTGFNWTPLRFKTLQPADTARFNKLAALSSNNSSSSHRPVRLSFHVTLDRINQLKQEVLAEADAIDGGSNAGSNKDKKEACNTSSRLPAQAWCTTHNVVLASVLKAYGRLAGRQHVPHDVSVAVDMRNRMPLTQQQLLDVDPDDVSEQQQQQQRLLLQRAVGNFFASAILEGVHLLEANRVQLAMGLQAAVQRAMESWLLDLAWVAVKKGEHTRTAAAAANTGRAPAVQHGSDCTTGSASAQGQLPASACPASSNPEPSSTSAGVGTEVMSGATGDEHSCDVTWRRLHAMGPRALLQQQLDLGLLASMSTTQWPLDFYADAGFAGHVPLLSVPSFSQPQPFPLVLMQQATPSQGGGWMVHVFVDPEEAADFSQAVDAQGGL